MRRWIPVLAGLCLAALCAAQQTTYPVFETDKLSAAFHADRRAKLMAKLDPNSVAVFFTNPERNRNNDCDYRFRGDSNFLYLTGFEEPDAALIIAPHGITVDGSKVNEVLFVNTSNPMSETWLGYRMGPKDGKTLLRIEMVLPNSRFEEVIKSIDASTPVYNASVPDGTTAELRTMSTAFGSWIKGQSDRKGGLARAVMQMRSVKTPEEVVLIRKAAEISARGHVATMKRCKPGLREFNLQATMEFTFANEGCEAVGYNSIVGSGANSTILHYEDDRKVIQNGDMLCVDCAGEYHGYSADVTRSYPANGKFSPAQKAIYEIVYRAQEAGIKQCREGNSFNAPHQAAAKIISDGLIKLGIIKDARDVGRYFMHGTSHGLGLDVHDPGVSRLVPGVTLTVEPGIYIKAGSPCDKKYWNIGVRIEDDILVTKADPINLSAGAPRSWQDVERVMKK